MKAYLSTLTSAIWVIFEIVVYAAFHPVFSRPANGDFLVGFTVANLLGLVIALSAIILIQESKP